MTTRQSLETSIAARQAEIDAMVRYPGGKAVVAEDHCSRVVRLMHLRDKDINRLRELIGETEGK